MGKYHKIRYRNDPEWADKVRAYQREYERTHKGDRLRILSKKIWEIRLYLDNMLKHVERREKELLSLIKERNELRAKRELDKRSRKINRGS